MTGFEPRISGVGSDLCPLLPIFCSLKFLIPSLKNDKRRRGGRMNVNIDNVADDDVADDDDDGALTTVISSSGRE